MEGLEGDEFEMMDVLIDEQEMPEPVKLRAICVVPDEWEKLGMSKIYSILAFGFSTACSLSRPKSNLTVR